MAELTRLELATFRVTGGRSNQTELQLHTISIFHGTLRYLSSYELLRSQPAKPGGMDWPRLAPRAGLEPAT